MIGRQAGPGVAALGLALAVMLCGGMGMGLNLTADRALVTGPTPFTEELSRRLADLPHDQREAVMRTCVEEVLHCDPSQPECVQPLFAMNHRDPTPAEAATVSALLFCIDRELGNVSTAPEPPEAAPKPPPAPRHVVEGASATAGSAFRSEEETASGPSLAVLGAGMVGGLVLALGALAAFFLGTGRSPTTEP